MIIALFSPTKVGNVAVTFIAPGPSMAVKIKVKLPEASVVVVVVAGDNKPIKGSSTESTTGIPANPMPPSTDKPPEKVVVSGPVPVVHIGLEAHFYNGMTLKSKGPDFKL